MKGNAHPTPPMPRIDDLPRQPRLAVPDAPPSTKTGSTVAAVIGVVLAAIIVAFAGFVTGSTWFDEPVQAAAPVTSTKGLTVADEVVSHAPCILRIPLIDTPNRLLTSSELRQVEAQFPYLQGVTAAQGSVTYPSGQNILMLVVTGWDCPPYDSPSPEPQVPEA